MKYTEQLLWILDKKGSWAKTLEAQEAIFQENIDFVHSLGLKCDCVGWCRMDLSGPKTQEILSEISTFCRKKGWSARGLYTRHYVDVESNWYELDPTDFGDDTVFDQIETNADNSGITDTLVIRAYHEMTTAPKKYGDQLFVPERFREHCIQNHVDDLDFCWARDVGKYKAAQYFHVYGRRLIPKVATDHALKLSNKKAIRAAGGWLPEIAKVFHTLQQISLPDCYLEEDLPADGFAYAYIPETDECLGRHTILIHKNTARRLLHEKLLPAYALRPAPVMKELPGGYVLTQTRPLPRPVPDIRQHLLSEYEKLKAIPRPERIITEKEAVKLLRKAKNERKEDFNKALPKVSRSNLPETPYRLMIPYYSVTNGGFLSDDYELFSYSSAVIENEAFQRILKAEELLEQKPDEIVIGKCPDGDYILLCKNGKVTRFSHEAPESLTHWPSLAQFIADALY